MRSCVNSQVLSCSLSAGFSCGAGGKVQAAYVLAQARKREGAARPSGPLLVAEGISGGGFDKQRRATEMR